MSLFDLVVPLGLMPYDWLACTRHMHEFDLLTLKD